MKSTETESDMAAAGGMWEWRVYCLMDTEFRIKDEETFGNGQ